VKFPRSFLTKVFNCCVILSYFSCGKGFKKELTLDASAQTGNYKSSLNSLNLGLGNHEGWARFSILGDQFWARLKITGPFDRQTIHPQYIAMGGTCPNKNDDLNRDGIIDILETIKVTGPLLLPLDGNINTRLSGIDNFLRIKKQGFYFYSKSSSLKRMLADLRKPSFFPDGVMKSLSPQEDLFLHKRIVLIMGISEDIRLSKSVGTIPGLPAHYTVPVACGEIEYFSYGPGIAD
jgi:hypothetical protein